MSPIQKSSARAVGVMRMRPARAAARFRRRRTREPQDVAIGIGELRERHLAGNDHGLAAKLEAARFELLPRVSTTSATLMFSTIEPLPFGDGVFVEADLQAGHVGVDVRELQVVAALGQREAERPGIERDRAIEIGDANLNEQPGPIPDLWLVLRGRRSGRCSDSKTSLNT